ncbi:protein YgfX [Solimonas marina]|uniref:Toxin CptA n=1 Tax=Solimonas marina TaxID=2714601 RepID=A0A970B809_9GAMM|nr:protein YgfX [Solimonas marina]NKF21789.1 hypothetical protein [Solimonas marina]
MAGEFAATVDLKLRPSFRALRLIFVLHIVCIGLLPFAMPSGWPMLVLVAAFAGSWFWLRRHPALGYGPRAIERVIWHADGQWTIFVGGREARATLDGRSVIHRRLLVLNFRSEASGRRYARLITSADAAPEPLRRLRARLLST